MTVTVNIQRPSTASAIRHGSVNGYKAFTTVKVSDATGGEVSIFLPDTGHAQEVADAINAAIAAGKPKLEAAEDAEKRIKADEMENVE